jgi:uncharacterized membrane protein
VVAVLVVVILVFPALAVAASRRSTIVERLSPVVVCYAFGILLANTGVVRPDTTGYGLARSITIATVLLAIPLLLFGTDFRAWFSIARPTIVSFGLAIVSVAVVASVASVLFSGIGADGWEVAGMMVGVYTGGTANMAAIATALDAPESTFVALNAADVVVGALYLLFLLTVAQRLLGRLLPPFVATLDRAEVDAHDLAEVGHDDPWAYRPPVPAILRGLGVALIVVALAVGTAFLLVGDADSAAFDTAAILGITTFGIAASFVPAIRRLPGTYEVGQYLFLVFAVAVGALANIADLAPSFTTVLPMLSAVLVGAVLLHVALAALFRIDTDTVIITSTAAVFGPPFVGPVAAVLRNREIVVSGLTTGVVGLAIGNYVGLAVAYLLRQAS